MQDKSDATAKPEQENLPEAADGQSLEEMQLNDQLHLRELKIQELQGALDESRLRIEELEGADAKKEEVIRSLKEKIDSVQSTADSHSEGTSTSSTFELLKSLSDPLQGNRDEYLRMGCLHRLCSRNGRIFEHEDHSFSNEAWISSFLVCFCDCNCECLEPVPPGRKNLVLYSLSN